MIIPCNTFNLKQLVVKAGYMFRNDGFLNDKNIVIHKSLVLPAPFLELYNTKNH